jgi:hypothetical protein
MHKKNFGRVIALQSTQDLFAELSLACAQSNLADQKPHSALAIYRSEYMQVHMQICSLHALTVHSLVHISHPSLLYRRFSEMTPLLASQGMASSRSYLSKIFTAATSKPLGSLIWKVSMRPGRSSLARSTLVGASLLLREKTFSSPSRLMQLSSRPMS